ncbi:MAG: hypothetical protein J6S85_19790 [Methanobrevibacter sp.]|nr:hypothetical protein [Methanobrevibacter sp.]
MKVTKEYCDICGKEMNIRLPVKLFRKGYCCDVDRNYDCCESCWIEVYRFIEELKEKSKV